MGCKYTFYKDDEKYYPYLYCKLTENRCPYTKKCLKVEKWIQIEEDIYKECPIFISDEQANIPTDSYFVQSYRYNNKGYLYLYVVIGDEVQRVLTDFTSINQKYVYLKETLDGYEASLVPFKDKK